MEDGVFFDTGSEIKRKERHGFQRMMASCRRDKIDLIITKSVTRFGRNIPVMLRAFGELRRQGVDILFETEVRQDAQILLKLYAAFVEEESITKSEITKWYPEGLPLRRQQACQSHLLRIRWDQDGKLTVMEQEALVVWTIFQSYLEGKSLCQISRLLEAHGIPSSSGEPLWNVDSIREAMGKSIQWSYTRRFQEGTYQHTNRTYGYRNHYGTGLHPSQKRAAKDGTIAGIKC